MALFWRKCLILGASDKDFFTIKAISFRFIDLRTYQSQDVKKFINDDQKIVKEHVIIIGVIWNDNKLLSGMRLRDCNIKKISGISSLN